MCIHSIPVIVTPAIPTSMLTHNPSRLRFRIYLNPDVKQNGLRIVYQPVEGLGC